MSYHNRKYKVQLRDTLKKVSDKFGYNENDLRDYHNNHCDFDKRIVVNIGELAEIILPPKGFTLKKGGTIDLDELTRVSCGLKGKLFLNPKTLNHTYGVVIKRIKDNKTTQYHYKTHFKFERVTKEDNFEILIDKQQVYVNNQAPNLIAEQLADACGSILYPLKITITRSGELHAIENTEEIETRWKNKREKILKYYQSPITKKIVTKMDATCSNPLKLLSTIKNNFFYNLYFSNLYLYHGTGLKVKYERDIPLHQFHIPYNFEILQSLNPYLTKSEKIKITQEGIHTGLQTKSKFIIRYKLIPTYNIIFSIEGSFITEEKKQLDKTEVRVYHLEYLEKQKL